MAVNHRRNVNNPFANRSRRTVGYSDPRYGNPHHHNQHHRGRKTFLRSPMTCVLVVVTIIFFFNYDSNPLQDEIKMTEHQKSKEVERKNDILAKQGSDSLEKSLKDNVETGQNHLDTNAAGGSDEDLNESIRQRSGHQSSEDTANKNKLAVAENDVDSGLKFALNPDDISNNSEDFNLGRQNPPISSDEDHEDTVDGIINNKDPDYGEDANQGIEKLTENFGIGRDDRDEVDNENIDFLLAQGKVQFGLGNETNLETDENDQGALNQIGNANEEKNRIIDPSEEDKKSQSAIDDPISVPLYDNVDTTEANQTITTDNKTTGNETEGDEEEKEDEALSAVQDQTNITLPDALDAPDSIFDSNKETHSNGTKNGNESADSTVVEDQNSQLDGNISIPMVDESGKIADNNSTSIISDSSNTSAGSLNDSETYILSNSTNDHVDLEEVEDNNLSFRNEQIAAVNNSDTENTRGSSGVKALANSNQATPPTESTITRTENNSAVVEESTHTNTTIRNITGLMDLKNIANSSSPSSGLDGGALGLASVDDNTNAMLSAKKTTGDTNATGEIDSLTAEQTELSSINNVTDIVLNKTASEASLGNETKPDPNDISKESSKTSREKKPKKAKAPTKATSTAVDVHDISSSAINNATESNTTNMVTSKNTTKTKKKRKNTTTTTAINVTDTIGSSSSTKIKKKSKNATATTAVNVTDTIGSSSSTKIEKKSKNATATTATNVTDTIETSSSKTKKKSKNATATTATNVTDTIETSSSKTKLKSKNATATTATNVTDTIESSSLTKTREKSVESSTSTKTKKKSKDVTATTTDNDATNTSESSKIGNLRGSVKD